MKKIDNISKILKIISSPVKIRILNLLVDKKLSLQDIHSVIFKEFKIKYPQTTYNYIEDLVEIKLVKKSYDQQDKLLKYSLINKKLIINFENMELDMK